MKYWLWRLSGKLYWKKLDSHYTDGKGIKCYAEWRQRGALIKDHICFKAL